LLKYKILSFIIDALKFPAESIPSAVIVLEPSSNGTFDAVKVPPPTEAAIPFTVTVAEESSIVPDTVIGLELKSVRF